MIILGLLAAPAAGAGVRWEQLTLEQALAKAEREDKLVMVDVWAEHCHSCGDMDEQLWDSAEGEELAEGLVCIKLASDKPEAIPLHRGYPILGLPAVIFLEPDGTEIDRIVGFTGGVDRFLAEARMLKSGADPLPAMEEQLAAHPTSQRLMSAVLEKYLYRQRLPEAERLLARLVELDADRTSAEARKGIVFVAKYHDYFTRNTAKAQEHWRFLLEEYIDTPSVGSGVSATFKHAQTYGKFDEWIDYICGLMAEHPESGRLCYYAAINAIRAGLKHQCLADAARKAHSLGIGPKDLDQKATQLEP